MQPARDGGSLLSAQLLILLTILPATSDGGVTSKKTSHLNSFVNSNTLINSDTPMSDVSIRFEGKIFDLIANLPGRKQCLFVSLAAEQASWNKSDVMAYISTGFKLSNGKTIAFKSTCKRYHFTRDGVNFSAPVFPLSVQAGAVALYNKLPVTFQCHILRLSFQSVPDDSPKPLAVRDRLLPLQSQRKLKALQAAEAKLQQRYKVANVAHRCAFPLTTSEEPSSTVRLSGQVKYKSWLSWSKHFKHEIIKLFGNYAKTDHTFPQPRFVSSRMSPLSMYHLHLVKIHTKGPVNVTLDFHVHIKEADTRAIPARVLLEALRRFNKTALLRTLHMVGGLSFAKVPVKSKDTEQSSPAVGRKQRLKQLLPVYLARYFSTLTREEKCSLVSSVITRSNSSEAQVLSYLSRRHIARNLRCNRQVASSVRTSTAHPRTDNSPVTFVHVDVGSAKENIKKGIEQDVQSPVVRTHKMVVQPTAVEVLLLVMVSILGVAMCGLIFMCMMYRRRRRRLRQLNSERRYAQQRQHDAVEYCEDWPARVETRFAKRQSQCEPATDEDVYQQTTTEAGLAPPLVDRTYSLPVSQDIPSCRSSLSYQSYTDGANNSSVEYLPGIRRYSSESEHRTMV